MKKIIFGSLLLSILVLGTNVNADEPSFTINSDSDESAYVEEPREESFDEESLREQYEQDNRKEQLTFDEYVKFMDFLDNSSIDESMLRSSRAKVTQEATGERKLIVDEAYRHIGKDYTQEPNRRMGANAFDCSGLSYYVFKQVTGKNIGTWTVPQESSGKTIAVKDAKPGDLLFWGSKGRTYHVAIYIGDNKYIHSPNYNEKVNVSPIWWNEFAPSFALRMDLKEAAPVNLNNYYTKGVSKVVTLTNGSFYSSVEFNNNTKKKNIKAGTPLTVQKIEYSAAGVPRLKTPNGYYSAAKSDVVKTVNNISDYYIGNVTKVVTTKPGNFYSSKEFSSKTQMKKINAGVPLTVQKIEYSSSGIPRLKTPNGYYSAAKSDVIKTVNNVSDYYIGNVTKVVTQKSDYFYTSPDFNEKTKIKKINSGIPLTVQGIEYSSTGIPRLRTPNGYFTAAKSDVIKTVNNISDYYIGNVKRVVTLNEESFYTSPEFNDNTHIKKIRAEVPLTVQGIEYTTGGIPRLKTPNGYFTAEKKHVEKIK